MVAWITWTFQSPLEVFRGLISPAMGAKFKKPIFEAILIVACKNRIRMGSRFQLRLSLESGSLCSE